MGTRKATGYIGALIFLLMTVAPPEQGGLGIMSCAFSLPSKAQPANDLYLDFNPQAQRMIVTARGQVFLVAQARGETIRPGSYGKWGHCPPGWFRVGPPVDTKGQVKFGPAFLGLFDVSKSGPMKAYRRQGIGIHGGGTGLKSPLASRQGWMPTLGCIRMQNEDLRSLVSLVNWARSREARVWIRVGKHPRVK